jgi:hypothetical protein
MMIDLPIRFTPNMRQNISIKRSFQSETLPVKFIQFFKLEESGKNFCSDVLSSGEDSPSAQGRECLSVLYYNSSVKFIFRF